MKAVKKTESGDFSVKLIVSAGFRSRHRRRKPRTRGKEKDGSCEERGGSNGRKAEAVLVSFWMAAPSNLDGKSTMELLMERSRLNLHQSFDYSPE